MAWGARSGCLLGALALGCARPSPPPAGPDQLVLEIGGSAPSLRAALARVAAASAKPAPAPAPTAPPPPAVAPPERPPAAEPAPAGPPARTARLRPGSTLFALAREHLGDGNRWREIAELNGWSEADTTSLPAGIEVKLPAR